MVEHVVQSAGHPEQAAETKAERDDTHVFDAGISHQPLDPRLSNDEQRADQQGNDAKGYQHSATNGPTPCRIGDRQIA